MRKNCILFLLSIIISVAALVFCGGCQGVKTGEERAEYLRIHIRADSNATEAQAVKYAVKDAVVAYLTPLVSRYADKQSAVAGIGGNLSQIERVSTAVLQSKGFSYAAKAQIRKETFPTRVYGGYTLPAGEYTALVIDLGSGDGDNWWCVVYPPLCFTSPTGQNVIYKSKIAEIIQKWRLEDKNA